MEKCPCQTYVKSCCACVSMHCDECHGHSKFVQGRFCSNCGRPLKAELTPLYVPKSEEGAECPTCHGTGRIGTTDWLTKNISKKQLAEEKAKAIAEHEQHIKAEVAREIFAEIDKKIKALFTLHLEEINKEYIKDTPLYDRHSGILFALQCMDDFIAEPKKKYTEDTK